MELGPCHRPIWLPSAGPKSTCLQVVHCTRTSGRGDGWSKSPVPILSPPSGTLRSAQRHCKVWWRPGQVLGAPAPCQAYPGSSGPPPAGPPLTQAQLMSDAGVSGGQTQAREGLDPRIAQTQPLREAGSPWILGTESPAETPQGSERVCAGS